MPRPITDYVKNRDTGVVSSWNSTYANDVMMVSCDVHGNEIASTRAQIKASEKLTEIFKDLHTHRGLTIREVLRSFPSYHERPEVFTDFRNDMYPKLEAVQNFLSASGRQIDKLTQFEVFAHWFFVKIEEERKIEAQDEVTFRRYIEGLLNKDGTFDLPENNVIVTASAEEGFHQAVARKQAKDVEMNVKEPTPTKEEVKAFFDKKYAKEASEKEASPPPKKVGRPKKKRK